MKKTFQLVHPKKKYDRMVEAVRKDIRKYFKRERNKALPEGVDFWDFDCKFGDTEAEAREVHAAEISQCITQVSEKKLLSFYVQILAKPGQRKRKPQNS
jgi:hypothetical protein